MIGERCRKTVRDTTEPVGAEGALWDDLSYAQNIVDTVREPLVVLDESLKVISANRSFYRTFDVTPEESENNLLFDLGNRQWDNPKLRELLEEVLLKSTTIEDFEVEHDFPSLGLRTMLLNARRVYSEAGITKMILLAIEDITGHKEAESLIMRHSAVIEAINRVLREAFICETDREVAIVCLEAAEEITGSKFSLAGELNEEGRFDTLAYTDPGMKACKMPEDIAWQKSLDREVRGVWAQPIMQGKGLIIENPSSHPSSVGTPEGHPPIERFIGVPLMRGDRVTGVMAAANKDGDYTVNDRTDLELLAATFVVALDRIRSERHISEYSSLLEATNRELEAFAYSVSHDLRAPLRSIDGFSLALLEDYSDVIDDEGKDYLRRVRQASQTMALLIDDLLSLSRVTRSEMHRGHLNLGKMAGDISEKLRETAPERVVEFVIPRGIRATGDPVLVRVLLENLIGNAWKFTSKEKRARIEFGTEKTDGGDVFFVRDNGVGFDMKYHEKLFVPFQRLYKKTEFSGTGIGLASAQSIVRRHGGSIRAEAEPGKGATFYFTLGPEKQGEVSRRREQQD
jgi:PAS domain S-box-containing protein